MKIKAWAASSLDRQFPMGGTKSGSTIKLLAARGERVSFQTGFQFDGIQQAVFTVDVKAAGGLRAFARRVHSVPVPRHNTATPVSEMDGVGLIPGYVPDALMPLDEYMFAPMQTHAYWISVDVPADCRAGTHNVTVTLSSPQGRKIVLKAAVQVAGVTLKPRRNFPITHWFYADAIADWYKVEPWSKEFWPIVEKYMRNFAEHGSNTIYVPVFTPPLDGVKTPTQLLGVKKLAGGKYKFDWKHVKTWIKTAKKAGVERFEWTHWFTQWGVKTAIRIYESKAGQHHGPLLWKPETGATSPTYRNFLSQFLPELEKFLKREKLMSVSHFHVSDEPHGDEHLENYRKARELLKELAPWMKVMDALSDIRYGREGLTDTPIPSIQTALQYHEEGIPSWCYYCCGPRGNYLNRLLDTPLAKIRMNGWLFYRWQFGGFLHWGYNYWYKRQTTELIDPYTCSDAHFWPGWAHGDTFVVYPGPADVGPVDSMRWEIFHESLQDYQLLQTLDVDPDGKQLAELKSFEDFPKNETWITKTRRSLLR